MQRLCKDFNPVAEALGFIRTRSGSRSWQRPYGVLAEVIHLHRSGSSYGAPINNSVSIRAEFIIKAPDSPASDAWLDSDKLKDSNGYHYHLRFNALTWSTYDRCLQDLERVTKEHAVPWFDRHRA
jgi:hypothetical protein